MLLEIFSLVSFFFLGFLSREVETESRSVLRVQTALCVRSDT